MAEGRIVVIGSSNMDLTLKGPRIPRQGETVLGGNFSMAPGGKGANQAVAAARAGGTVSLIARIGNDFFGERAIRSFAFDRIDVSHTIEDRDNPSGIAMVFVGENGENCIGVAAGANTKLSVEDVERSREAVLSASILLMQLETPLETVCAAAEIAVGNNIKVILNPAPARQLPSSLLKNVFILTPNEFEAGVLAGFEVHDDDDADRAADKLLEEGVKTVIITLGARGAFVAGAEFRGLVPGFLVHAVDSTGAGDVFNGALAVAWSEGKDIRTAVVFANAAAAISVTKLGAQPSIPRRKEIDRFLSAHVPSPER
jgi:ribokinase